MNAMPKFAETNIPIGWCAPRVVAAPTSSPGKYMPYATDYVDRFRDLVRRWRLETATSSSLVEMVENSNFQLIVRMGTRVAPYIVREMKSQRDFLFMALAIIFPEENPVPNSAKGKPHEMIDAWLRWAERNKINAH